MRVAGYPTLSGDTQRNPKNVMLLPLKFTWTCRRRVRRFCRIWGSENPAARPELRAGVAATSRQCLCTTRSTSEMSLIQSSERNKGTGEFRIMHPMASDIVATAETPGWVYVQLPRARRSPLSRWLLELEECSCFLFRLHCRVNKRGPRLHRSQAQAPATLPVPRGLARGHSKPHPAGPPFIASSCGSTTGRPRCPRPSSANHLKR